MKIKVNESYNAVVVELKGDVMGGPKTEEFSTLLHGFIDKKKPNVIVDLGNVKFMNSSGLGMLIGGLTTMRKAGGDLRICRADQRIESLLIVTKLITVFQHFKTLDEAVASYESTDS